MGRPAMRRSRMCPKLLITRMPTVNPPSAGLSLREEVPMPALKSEQIIPVPPPTDPPAAGDPLLENVPLIGEDGGDAGADRPPPPPQRTRRPADDGGMADQDALHVRDGVPLPWPEAPERNAQLARAMALLHDRALSRL